MDYKARVLIVDDEKLICERVADLFDDMGWSTKIAHDVDTARTLATEHQPDLLVIDWLLHDKQNGFDVAMELREEFVDLKVLIITGLPNMQPFEESGWLKLLKKPFREMHLRRAVNVIMSWEQGFNEYRGPDTN